MNSKNVSIQTGIKMIQSAKNFKIMKLILKHVFIKKLLKLVKSVNVR